MNHPLIQPNTPFDAVILASGDYPTHALPLAVLHHATTIVCCDSAIEQLHPSLLDRVEAIVGDGDSLSPVFRQRYQRLLHIETEQEHNDLTKATRYCMAQNYRKIAYLGITGKRIDHTVGNLSLLVEYLRREQIHPIAITDDTTIVPCVGDNRFETFAQQQVSIFNFDCNVLTSEALRWSIYPFQTWWQGTLNEAIGTSITIHADNHYLVCLSHAPKIREG